MTKSGREITEISRRLTIRGRPGRLRSWPKTVAHYVAVRDAGGDPLATAVRPRLIDGFMDKVEKLAGWSKGKIRADVQEDAAVRGLAGLVPVPGGDPRLGPVAGHLTWCTDQVLRAAGGAPTYLQTDNARTITVDHVAGIPVSATWPGHS